MNEPLGNLSGQYIPGTNVPKAYALQPPPQAPRATERSIWALRAEQQAEAERKAQAWAAREAGHAAAVREADMNGLTSGVPRLPGALDRLPVLEPLGAEDLLAAGPYQLRARLGKGATGQVYLGFSPSGTSVAVKILNAGVATDEKFLARFADTVRVNREISRYLVARVVDAGESAHRLWVATELVPRPSLADVVAALGPLSGSETWCLVAGLVRALTGIRQSGPIRCVLKPSNVLLVGDGVRIIDTGIAYAAGSDEFSLETVLAYAATGRYPFARSVPDLKGITGPLRDVITRRLDKYVSDRELFNIAQSIPNGLTAYGAAWPGPFAELLRECERQFGQRVHALKP